MILVLLCFLSVISALNIPLSNRRISIIKSSRLFSSSSPHLPVNHDKVKYEKILELKEEISSLKKFLKIVDKSLKGVEMEISEEKSCINQLNIEIDKISTEIDGLTLNEAALLSKTDRKRKLEERKERLESWCGRLEDTRDGLDQQRRETALRLLDNEKGLSDALGKCQTCI